MFRRFVLNEQAPWSTTLPPFLFLIMTWFGCAYNVKLRTHLAFKRVSDEHAARRAVPLPVLDAVLWLGFCWIVIVTSARLTANSAANFQILLGTDDVLQWWFLISVPIAFPADGGAGDRKLVIEDVPQGIAPAKTNDQASRHRRRLREAIDVRG